MNFSNNQIEVSAVTKTFQIPHEKRDTLKEHFTNFFRRLSYKDFNALSNVDFSVKKGEFLGIIGSNGSGKSTLLKILAGIYQPTEGKVRVNGRISPFLELGVGFNADLTGKENVYLNGTILGLPKKEIDKRYREIVKFAELENFMDTKIKNYSSGMHVRLAFSIAIQADADIFLCDEVLAVGDFAFQKKCFDVFFKLKNEGKTIIYVSHDISSIRRFCTRCLWLDKGKIVAEGKTDDVVDKYIYGIGEKEVLKKSKKDDETDMSDISNKLVTIEDYKVLDKNGNFSTNFCSGDDLKIRVKFKANDPKIKEVNLGIAIYDEDGRFIFGDTCAWHKVFMDAAKGEGEVTIEELPFLSGSYFVTLGLANIENTQQYDWVNKKIKFSVYNSGFKQGIIEFKTKWSDSIRSTVEEKTEKMGKEAAKNSNQLMLKALFAETMEERQAKYRELGIKIGKNVFMDYGVWLEPPFPDLITIEDNVILSAFSKLVGHDSALQNILGFPVKKGAIVLRRNCYLGNSVTVLPGVTIGEEAIIGAASVVTKSVPPGEIWAGVPAKKINDLSGFLAKNMELLKIKPELFVAPITPYLPKDKVSFSTQGLERATPPKEYLCARKTEPLVLDEIIKYAYFFEGCSALDIGCGEGILCKKSRDAGIKKIKGIDYREDMIAIAKKHFKEEGIFDVLDFKDLRPQYGKFDRIFLIDFLSHLTNWEKELLFALTGALLNKDGRVLVYDPLKIEGENFGDFQLFKKIELSNGGSLLILKK